MSKDDLGQRMKNYYEHRSRYYLDRRTPVIIRLDGKAFHTFTKGLKADGPFNEALRNAMVASAEYVVSQMQNCVAFYHQSDEVSFLLDDTKRLETQAWFDYNKSKIETIAASAMTARFNSFNLKDAFGLFDARSFNIPREEVPNYFIWRMRDWERNSVQMLGQHYMTQSELHGKSCEYIKEFIGKLATVDDTVDVWELLDDRWKYGTLKTYGCPGYEGKEFPLEDVKYNDLDELFRSYNRTIQDVLK